MPPNIPVRWPLATEHGVIGWAVWDAMSDRIEVPGGYLPAQFYVDFPGTANEPSVKATFIVRGDGSVGCSSISIEAKREGPEVKRKDLEAAQERLNDWMQFAAMSALQDAAGQPVVPIESDRSPAAIMARQAAVKAYNDARSKSRRKVTPDLLAEVAQLYRANIDDGPWLAIRDRYGVAESTAARYVMLARQAGLLPQTEPGKKKA